MPWMTLVQHAGTTRTVSGPAALSTYRSARESLQPAHADVHFSTYSSWGISAIVFNSCSDITWTGRREKRSRNYHYLLSTVHEKSIISFPTTGVHIPVTFTPPGYVFKGTLFQQGIGEEQTPEKNTVLVQHGTPRSSHPQKP